MKNGEKESHGWSTMEKYEWDLGVCILDWGRPLSDRERCGCSQWWFITCIRGRRGEWMGQPLVMSQYFQWAASPLPLSFIFIWKHVHIWRKQQISAARLLAHSFQHITDVNGELVVLYLIIKRDTVTVKKYSLCCKKKVQKFLLFNSSCFFFLQCQHVGPEMYIYSLLHLALFLFPGPVKHKEEEGPVRNTGFILYKLQESCSGL